MADSVRPHGLQPTGFLRPWGFPARVLEWVAIAFSLVLSAAAAKSLQLCLTLCDPRDGRPRGSLGFSSQEHWSGLPFPSPMSESEKSK